MIYPHPVTVAWMKVYVCIPAPKNVTRILGGDSNPGWPPPPMSPLDKALLGDDGG